MNRIIYFFIFLSINLSFSYSVLIAQKWNNLNNEPNIKFSSNSVFLPEDNKILIFGGITTENNSTWVYDLEKRSWLKKEPFGGIKPSSLTSYCLCYLTEDKVLLFGGYDKILKNDTWIYDYSENTWTLITPKNNIKPSPRQGSSMLQISSDKVLLYGGNTGSLSDETWIYDYSENRWQLLDPLNITKDKNISPLQNPAMSKIGYNNVLLIEESPNSVGTWIYNMDNNTWEKIIFPLNFKSPKPLNKNTFVNINRNETMLVASDGTQWIFNILTRKWTLLNQGLFFKNNVSISNIGNDSLLLIEANDQSKNDIFRYYYSNNQWIKEIKTELVSLPLSGHSMASIDNEIFLIFGGFDGSLSSNTKILNIKTKEIKKINNDSSIKPRKFHSSCFLTENEILTFGGFTDKPNNETLIFDAITSKWSNYTEQITKSPSERSNHSLCSLDEGKALLFGGKHSTSLNDLWIFDKTSMNWNELILSDSAKPSPRYSHSATMIGNDKMVIFGGIDNTINNELWMFDLTLKKWSFIKTKGTEKPTPRYGHSICYLGNNQLFLFGGYSTTYLNDCWSYNLLDSTWRSLNIIDNIKPSPRNNFAMIRSERDEVVLYGGYQNGNLNDIWTFSLSSYSNFAPELLKPNNNSKSIVLNPKFEWEKISSESSYIIELSDSISFNNIIFSNQSKNNYFQYNENLSPDKNYFWRVRTIIGQLSSKWSEIYHFKTKIDYPILILPKNNSDGINRLCLLKWDSVEKVSKYRLQISQTKSFESFSLDKFCDSAEFQLSNKLLPNTLYFWRVAAVDGIDTSEWSPVFSFTTILAEPTLLSPKNDSNNVSVQLVASWEKVDNAISYKFELSDSETFSTKIISKLITASSYSIDTKLQNNSKYFWRVQAYDDQFNSDWSDIWNFTTEDNNSIVDKTAEFSYGDKRIILKNQIIKIPINSTNTIKLCLYNINGIEVKDSNICKFYTEDNFIDIDSNKLNCGIYFLVLINEDQSEQLSFIISK